MTEQKKIHTVMQSALDRLITILFEGDGGIEGSDVNTLGAKVNILKIIFYWFHDENEMIEEG